MKIIRAIFTKQAKDMFKNPAVLVMFVVFPAVALIMKMFVNIPDNEYFSGNMFVTMMASIFAGMGLVSSASAVVAEDISGKRLRFLLIAGVKPYQYLLGTGGFYLVAGAAASAVFNLIGGFWGMEAVKFLSVMITGLTASVILGMLLGILAGNGQAAAGLSMPVAVIVGFTPMIAGFNETVAKVAEILYTQQINVIVNDFSISLAKPLLVITANIAVFAVLFVFAYRKKGLKG